MEIKVSVEGVPRVVCGVTEKTTCQEVVLALAQAQGRTGRYTLKEKFKKYERNMTPDERLLESLEKYSQQAREVQLTLERNGPSLGDGGSRLRGSRYQPGTQLKRVDGGARVRRGSAGVSWHRQSLPPSPRPRLHSEPTTEDPKTAKRKSLTLMEEAWGWLENLGRSGKRQLGDRDEGKGKEDKGNGHARNIVTPAKDASTPGGLKGKDKKETGRVTEHQSIISCLGNHGKGRGEKDMGEKTKRKGHKQDPEANATSKPDAEGPQITRAHKMEKERGELRGLVIRQQASLKELQSKIDLSNRQICELEERQRAKQRPEALPQLTEEGEQLEYWVNELKAEEGYERDLQKQFLEMKEKAAECKAKLEEYKCKLQGCDLARDTRTTPAEQKVDPSQDATAETWTPGNPACLTQHSRLGMELRPTPNRENAEKKRVTTVDSKLNKALVPPKQIADSRFCGQSQLREWWTQWSDAQSPTSGTKPKVHRSEITIHLGSTRV